jgi:hypothetical protein
MEIRGSPQLIDMVTIYHLITNEIDSKKQVVTQKNNPLDLRNMPC